MHVWPSNNEGRELLPLGKHVERMPRKQQQLDIVLPDRHDTMLDCVPAPRRRTSIQDGCEPGLKDASQTLLSTGEGRCAADGVLGRHVGPNVRR